MRGRKPLSTEMHRLCGTYRENRHGGTTPQPTAGLAPPPKHLDAMAKKEFRRVGRLLADSGVVTLAELAALACYAQAWSRMIEAETKLRETGLVVKSPAGFPCISPYLSIATKAGEEIRKWASELGLTPAARTKLRLPSPDEPGGKLSKYIGVANRSRDFETLDEFARRRIEHRTISCTTIEEGNDETEETAAAESRASDE